MRALTSKLLWWSVFGLLLLVAGCATTQSRYYSSAVDYLYPDKKEPVEKPAIPVMKIPMKVGIAFVPDAGQYARSRNFWQSFAAGSHANAYKLTENQKTKLMQEVANYFRKYSFIGSIEIIPSAYLKPRGSFANLDQIRTMYGIDAIALLSVDQVQFTDEGAASFLYWTIIGAYTIPGEKNTTNTMMDAVVFDIKSRKMLFRAPGLSEVKGHATPVNISEELRQDSSEGFQIAAKDMIQNLDTQLAAFREKVKQSPREYKVVERPGYHGGGSFNLWFIALLLLIKVVAVVQRRRLNA
jgi:rhombotail lipoprotein